MARKLPKTIIRALENSQTIEEFAKRLSRRYEVSISPPQAGSYTVYLAGRGLRDYWLEVQAGPDGLKLLQARVLVW